MLLIGVSIQRKPWLTTLFTTISALLNVGLNIILIPLYGAIGAATATLAAYVVFTFVAHFVSQQFYPVSFEVKLLFISLLVGIALYIGGYYLTQTQGVYEVWTVDIATLGLYAGFLILLAKCTPLSEGGMPQ
jgi:O-antigen/teichoic acid export membrane protein